MKLLSLYNTFIVNVLSRHIFSFFFASLFCMVVIFNEENENDVGAIPKSSRVALSPMLCISEYISYCNK
jgi:hypothetical protein